MTTLTGPACRQVLLANGRRADYPAVTRHDGGNRERWAG